MRFHGKGYWDAAGPWPPIGYKPAAKKKAALRGPVNPASDRSRGGEPAGHTSLPGPLYLDRQRRQIPRTSTSYFLHGHRWRDLLRCSLHSNNRVAVEFLPAPATANLASKVGSSPFSRRYFDAVPILRSKWPVS